MQKSEWMTFSKHYNLLNPTAHNVSRFLCKRSILQNFCKFDRLYVLRNQIFHGGATFNSKANRDQLRDACDILGDLFPAIISDNAC